MLGLALTTLRDICTLLSVVLVIFGSVDKISEYSLWMEFIDLGMMTERSDFITSAEEGGYVFGAVCLSVCLSVCPSDYSQTCERILTKFFWRGRAWLKDQVIQFWWRSGSCFGSGSPKSEIRILQIGGGLCSLSIAFLFQNEITTVRISGVVYMLIVTV